MAWAGSNRAARLPANWAALRRRVIRRDGGRCTAVDSEGQRCTWPGTDVDHKTPGDDHSLSNLRLLCAWHHARKSATEGGTAAALTRVRTARTKPAHPALED
jgi:5-methylcytosine-specific restriction protein A